MGDQIESSDLKSKIAGNLVLLSPPCEFDEVVKDVKNLCSENAQCLNEINKATKQYLIDQFTQVTLPGNEFPTIVCLHGHLEGNKFLCPRSHNTFELNIAQLTASNVEKAPPDNGVHGSSDNEMWRIELEKLYTEYVTQHFNKGAVSVFAVHDKANPQIIIYAESHYGKNEATGRWRSKWTINLGDNPIGSDLEVVGSIKIQTHLYEEGNVQLISSKEIKLKVPAPTFQKFAHECVAKIKHAEDLYQVAISENFKAMSENTFKTLRRQLPMTKSKIDWNNIITYCVGQEIGKSNN